MHVSSNADLGGLNADRAAFMAALATNLAGWFAHAGERVMLGDIDRQQSARAWLALRPAPLPTARPARR